ncbi:MAG: hypothetical protein LBR23_04560 [Spirochaetaceae bacterium]|jgi:hypothetical protein|nr:hypothetical protein [Spirochaetaceae bacterium]
MRNTGTTEALPVRITGPVGFSLFSPRLFAPPGLDAPGASPAVSPDVIVEENGLFTIPRDASLPDFEQDFAFKSLVESILPR